MNAGRSFAADETRDMRDAYALASDALRVTHRTNGDLEEKLASIILYIYTAEKTEHPERFVDVRALAQEGVDTLVRFSNAEMRSARVRRIGI